jgi:hypothetical protein
LITIPRNTTGGMVSKKQQKSKTMAKQDQEELKDKLGAMLPGEVKQSVIDGWKSKYGQVITVVVTLDDETKCVGYYKKPTRDIIANCVNDASTGKVFEAREFLANNTWLGGDDRHRTNDDVAIPAQVELWKSLNFLKAEATKY